MMRYTSVLLLIAVELAAAATENVAVVGAGISGLVAAVRLQHLGHKVTVFERAPVILPIIQTLDLDGTFYDYLSVALCPIPRAAGSSTALGELAQQYGQPYEPLEATLVSLSFDTTAGITQVPTAFQPYANSPAGQQVLLTQLVKGYQLIQQLDQYEATPQGAIEAGMAYANQTYGEWAATASLPAFTNVSASLVDSAVSGPAEAIASPTELLINRNYSPGLLRRAFLSAGILPNSTEADALGVADLLGDTDEPYTFFSLPQGVRTLFENMAEQEQLDIRLNTSVRRATAAGTVTLAGGEEQTYDKVIVTVKPDSAADMLPEELASIYRQAHSGYNDAWLFNASFPSSPFFDGAFIGDSTIGGLAPSRLDGYPTYILRVDGRSPWLSAGGYVATNVTEEESTAVAIEALESYGFEIHGVQAYARVQFPTYLSYVPDIDHLGNVFLLGETVAGVGINTNVESANIKIAQWFGSH